MTGRCMTYKKKMAYYTGTFKNYYIFVQSLFFLRLTSKDLETENPVVSYRSTKTREFACPVHTAVHHFSNSPTTKAHGVNHRVYIFVKVTQSSQDSPIQKAQRHKMKSVLDSFQWTVMKTDNQYAIVAASRDAVRA